MQSDDQTYGALYVVLGLVWVAVAFVPILPALPGTESSGSGFGAFLVLAAIGALHVCAGLGLRAGRSRPRNAVRLIAVVYLFLFPLFTALGVLTLLALRQRTVAA